MFLNRKKPCSFLKQEFVVVIVAAGFDSIHGLKVKTRVLLSHMFLLLLPVSLLDCICITWSGLKEENFILFSDWSLVFWFMLLLVNDPVREIG